MGRASHSLIPACFRLRARRRNRWPSGSGLTTNHSSGLQGIRPHSPPPCRLLHFAPFQRFHLPPAFLRHHLNPPVSRPPILSTRSVPPLTTLCRFLQLEGVKQVGIH